MEKLLAVYFCCECTFGCTNQLPGADLFHQHTSLESLLKKCMEMVIDCCLVSGDNIHLKILVPSIAAGAIIGKGGETIAQVQKEAGARVKMSKANDFYPGKTGRLRQASTLVLAGCNMGPD